MNQIKKNISKLNIPPLCFDYGFKSIFSQHKDVLKRLIYDITGINTNKLDIISSNIANKIPYEKAKTCDLLLKSNECFIDIEINTSNYNVLFVKNACYIFDIYATYAERGKKYNPDILFMQINLNCFSKYDKLFNKYEVSDNSNNLYVDNLKIYDFYIAKTRKKDYNKINECKHYGDWAKLLGSYSFDEMRETAVKLLGNKKANSFMKTVYEVISSEKYGRSVKRFMSEERYQRLVMEEIKRTALKEGRETGWQLGLEEGQKEGRKEGLKKGHEEGRAEGRAEGRVEGIQQNINAIIKNMISKNYSIDIISDVTGKTPEEINKYILTN